MLSAQAIQDAWNKQARWLVILRPFSWLYQLGQFVHHQLYKYGLKSVYTAPVPVMVIGNITVGGSGKTPLLIELANYLTQHKIRVGVISRGYGGKGPFPALVKENTDPSLVGDEPCLIVRSTKLPMAVGSDRRQAIELLLEHYQIDLILSDDGLQHKALRRQIEWIVFDTNRGLGNQKLLPEGFLRESKKRLEKGTVIEHGLHPQSLFTMYLKPAAPYLLNTIVSQQPPVFHPNNIYHPVVGIGFPQRFYETLKSIGIATVDGREFPDHHQYKIFDLVFDDLKPIITTEKDAVKMISLLRDYPEFEAEIWVVPVEAVLSDECYQLLNQQLDQLGIKVSMDS